MIALKRVPGCKFIAGDPQQSGWRYCGKPVVGLERAWCCEHRPIIYQPVSVRSAAQKLADETRSMKARVARQFAA